MLLSTFEILVKSQLQQGSLSPLSRTVIQGYFLTISNVNFFDVTLSLVFTSLSPPLVDVLPFLDVTGMNMIGNLTEVGFSGKSRFTLTIPANDTGLFLLQPDIINKPEILTNADFEVRGFVEIFLSSLSGRNSADLLVTPEQRGTFFRDLDANNPPRIGLDQIAYSIPTATGGSLITLSNA